MNPKLETGTRFETLVGLTGLVASSWVAGSVGGISLISIPALIDTIVSGTLPHHVAPQLWRVIFERGKATMPIAAATAAACYGTLARSRYASQRPWIPFALSSVTTIAIVPFTVIAMSGTNGSLIQLSAGQNVRDLSVEGLDARAASSGAAFNALWPRVFQEHPHSYLRLREVVYVIV
ncbi:hypothetical protein G7054_g4898 [Neopestalotiopsis clavispora]|nr:hypothetical protein G7054_g4898 [Neopestalotiopsis clavispora]